MKVLVLADHYLPGYKAGGPIRSLSGMVDRIGGDFALRIVTRDRDFGDTEPYAGIERDRWQSVGKAEVLYASPQQLAPHRWKALLTSVEYDVLYLNSFFSPVFTIQTLTLRRLRLLPRRPVLVAPRGEFSPGALALKASKKRAFMKLARVLGLYSEVVWHATSGSEREDIHRELPSDPGTGLRVMVAPNLRATADGAPAPGLRRSKAPGRLRVAFVSRISRKKNLDGALKVLAGLTGEIDFGIFGTLEDEGYWAECRELMRALPSNIRAEYGGPLEHDAVPGVLQQYDLFFLPTRGENFGHAIVEAMTAGCPVLLSDQTPWRDLERQRVGWDIPLADATGFRAALERCIAMGPEEHAEWSSAARAYATRVAEDPDAVRQVRELFLTTVREATSCAA